jgi:hypothetical protein
VIDHEATHGDNRRGRPSNEATDQLANSERNGGSEEASHYSLSGGARGIESGGHAPDSPPGAISDLSAIRIARSTELKMWQLGDFPKIYIRTAVDTCCTRSASPSMLPSNGTCGDVSHARPKWTSFVAP